MVLSVLKPERSLAMTPHVEASTFSLDFLPCCRAAPSLLETLKVELLGGAKVPECYSDGATATPRDAHNRAVVVLRSKMVVVLGPKMWVCWNFWGPHLVARDYGSTPEDA